MYKLLFPSYWVDSVHGADASAVPLLKDTWLGRTYPDTMSVQCYETRTLGKGEPKGSITTTYGSIETWLQQGERTTACVPPPTATGDEPDAAIVVQMSNASNGTTTMVVMVAHLDVLRSDHREGPRQHAWAGTAGCGSESADQQWAGATGDYGGVKWVISSRCGSKAPSAAMVERAPAVASVILYTRTNRRAARAGGGASAAATRALRSTRGRIAAAHAADTGSAGADLDEDVLTHALGLHHLRRLARFMSPHASAP